MVMEEIEKYITNETNPEKLRAYIHDKDPDVMAALAANESCTVEMNELLRVNGDEVTKAVLAGKKSADAKLLERLARDESVLVRLTVAENPNTPVEVLERLAEDSDKDVRRMLQRNTQERKKCIRSGFVLKEILNWVDVNL